MQNEVVIDQLNVQDEKEIDSVLDLVNKAYRTTDGWTHEVGLASGKRTSKESITEDVSAENTQMFLAKHKEHGIIGCIKLQLNITSTVVGPLPKPACYFGLLAVTPSYQSKGVASLLIKYVEDICIQRGEHAMVIDVLSTRPDIIAWYSRHGYEEVASSSEEGAEKFMKSINNQLLLPTRFILLEKSLDGRKMKQT